MNEGDTIFALSSGGGVGGVAVVRVSGDLAGHALCALSGQGLPAARRATLVRLRGPDSGRALDEALALWFPGPGSFTGEDVVEFQVHGGRAVVMGVLEALGRLAGLRMANGGEFTRRAVQNGRLDLVQAEGIGDLVLAETEYQRDQALRQVGGALSQYLARWQARLVGVLAHLEAAIDFSDEDLPGGLLDRVRADLSALDDEIGAVLAGPRHGERLREGYFVAIVGAPNVGKSSLVNALAGWEVAIVAAAAGTTRDVVETRLVLDGVPVTFADTAGLRDGVGDVEKEGIRRARAAGERSDLRLVVFDASDRGAPIDMGNFSGEGGEVILVANKCDLVDDDGVQGVTDFICISCKTGQGLDRLRQRVSAALGWAAPRADGIVLTRARHREALEDCSDSVARALTGKDIVVMAEDMRLAVRALGRVLGVVDVEDVLDVVFGEFCIGK